MERKEESQTYIKEETIELNFTEAVDTINTYRSNVKETGLVKGVLVKRIGDNLVVFTILTDCVERGDPRYQEVRSLSCDLMPTMKQTGISISKIYIGSVMQVRNKYFELKSGIADS